MGNSARFYTAPGRDGALTVSQIAALAGDREKNIYNQKIVRAVKFCRARWTGQVIESATIPAHAHLPIGGVA